MLKLFLRYGGDIVEFLIKEGVIVNAADSDGCTSFWYCAENSQTELCKMLVKQEADPCVLSERKMG
jgi:ankyrin repeat protein